MKKIFVMALISLLTCISACGEDAPKPSLSEDGVEEIHIEEINVEEIHVEEITWENSSNISRWEE